jgi:hypothetical protein
VSRVDVTPTDAKIGLSLAFVGPATPAGPSHERELVAVADTIAAGNPTSIRCGWERRGSPDP